MVKSDLDTAGCFWDAGGGTRKQLDDIDIVFPPKADFKNKRIEWGQELEKPWARTVFSNNVRSLVNQRGRGLRE